jgi:hypothetical protein
MADANRFRVRYGLWAIVAGASEGLGAAYARALARRGLDLVLAARRRDLLERLAEELHERHGISVRCIDGDLAAVATTDRLADEASGLDLGLLIYNAAHAPVGDFSDVEAGSLGRVVDVNVRGPLLLARAVLPGMTARGRGGIVLMSSMAGNQGTARIAAYAASKAFNRVLAEGLWQELAQRGIDVIACCAGDPGCRPGRGADPRCAGEGAGRHPGVRQPDRRRASLQAPAPPHRHPHHGCHHEEVVVVIDFVAGFFAPWIVFAVILLLHLALPARTVDG